MSTLTTLRHPNFFLVTQTLATGKARLSAPVFNPLRGLVPGEHLVLGWKHVLLNFSGLTPGMLVRLHAGERPSIATTVFLGKGGRHAR